ncbi:hypothetical protein [Chitinophaga qingshengii]|uniref:Uncharacterized protein n=1 Tax=Chitinophaga qingshengii TaxID=1569794 RepID=A0ABR7TH64_9BACT|nr:hypothetical protein [Chitinophaga qingshengii]MBC9929828.1 hypothetical protein [Chitinophaga qingshengii]
MKIIYALFFSAPVAAYFFRPSEAPVRPLDKGDGTLGSLCPGGNMTKDPLNGSSLQMAGIYIYVSGMSIICPKK